jgi:ribosomal-protein-serine acetyltransferase
MMLTAKLMPGVALRLAEERDADELYALVDRNRAYLARWMPWAAQETHDHVLDYIRITRTQVSENNGLNTVITVDGRLAGSLGMRGISWPDLSTELGYWLGEEHQRRGIVTAGVRAYLDYCFDTLGLNRVGLSAGVENTRSRAVAERLGFAFEGVQREAERLAGRAHDLATYSMLAGEWAARTGEG